MNNRQQSLEYAIWTDDLRLADYDGSDEIRILRGTDVPVGGTDPIGSIYFRILEDFTQIYMKATSGDWALVSGSGITFAGGGGSSTDIPIDGTVQFSAVDIEHGISAENGIISFTNVGPWKAPVIEIRDTPPLSPSNHDRYLIADSGATGDWTGHEDDIAEWRTDQWAFTTPAEGYITYDLDQNVFLLWDGLAWGPAVESGTGGVTGPLSSTDGAIAIYDGTGGNTLKNTDWVYNVSTLMSPNSADPTIQLETFPGRIDLSPENNGRVLGTKDKSLGGGAFNCEISALGKIGWGDGTLVVDTTLERSAANQLELGNGDALKFAPNGSGDYGLLSGVNSRIEFVRSSTGFACFLSRLTTDGGYRFTIDNVGKHFWAPAPGGSQDTSLERSAAGKLRLNGTTTSVLDLNSGVGNIQVGGANVRKTIILSARDATPNGTIGDYSFPNWPGTQAHVIHTPTGTTHSGWFVPMPDDWDGGSVNVYILGIGNAPQAGSTNAVRWGVTLRSIRAGDTIDVAGTLAEVTHTLTTNEASEWQVSPVISVTPNGTTSGSERTLQVKITRFADNVADTYSQQFALASVKIEYTSNAYGH